MPFTSGILIGIGETRRERIESLLALRDLHDRYGHIQEIIIQNFRAKPGTRMADAPEPDLDDHLWTIAVARLIFGPDMNIQAPPNLNPGALAEMIAAGINDWGGVSPVTRDHVNPEAPWPALDHLARQTAAAGKVLVPRLAIYPAYTRDRRALARSGTAHRGAAGRCDAEGFARPDAWVAGSGSEPPVDTKRGPCRSPASRWPPAPRPGGRRRGAGRSRDRAAVRRRAATPSPQVCEAADRLRRRVNGDTVSYVVTRNINYTNVCYFRCQFCAFSKGKLSENLRGRPYDLDLAEIQRRVEEAWERGATEVCLQGGIHPEYTGATYLGVCRAIKEAVPGIHIHAFSPLEIWQGAKTLGRTAPRLPARAEGGRAQLVARHRRRDPRRRGPRRDLPRQDQDRRNGSRSWRRRTASACAAPSRSCTAMSTATSTGRGTCCASAPCRRRPAALPNSCRCRSCRWRRRST